MADDPAATQDTSATQQLLGIANGTEAPPRLASSVLTPEQLAEFDAKFPNEQSSQWLDNQVAHRNYTAISEQLPSFAPTDPRVDAFYAQALAKDPNAFDNIGLAGYQDSGIIGQMLAAIPDAGQGSPLGGFGSLLNNERRDYVQDVRGGAAGDPSGLAQAQSPWYFGQEQPATDNWQLLPPPYRQPGNSMRNGWILNNSSADRGFALGMNPQGGVSAEMGNIVPHIGFGTGGRFGLPNLYDMNSWGQAAVVGWPGSYAPWIPLTAGAAGGAG